MLIFQYSSGYDSGGKLGHADGAYVGADYGYGQPGETQEEGFFSRKKKDKHDYTFVFYIFTPTPLSFTEFDL